MSYNLRKHRQVHHSVSLIEWALQRTPRERNTKDVVPLGLLISPVFELVGQEDGGNDRVDTKFTEHVIDYVLIFSVLATDI